MPAVIHCRLLQTLIAWVYVVTIWYDGEPFDYTFDAGSVMISERTVQAAVDRRGLKKEAFGAFLRDVYLETIH